jgi:hypothetical protein
MSDKWVTFAEAAAALKVHPRTVERQIKSGKLQSRRTEAGQLEVLIDMPEASPSATSAADALSVVAGQAENQVQFALGATSAIVKTAQEDARLARLDADRAWEETRVARQGSRIAWSAVATMAAVLMVAVGWTASAMTRSTDQVQHAGEQLRTVSESARQLSEQRDNLVAQLADANEKRSRAEGELSGRVSADEQTVALALRKSDPTTRPSYLVERIANLLSGPVSDTPGGQ